MESEFEPLLLNGGTKSVLCYKGVNVDSCNVQVRGSLKGESSRGQQMSFLYHERGMRTRGFEHLPSGKLCPGESEIRSPVAWRVA